MVNRSDRLLVSQIFVFIIAIADGMYPKKETKK